MLAEVYGEVMRAGGALTRAVKSEHTEIEMKRRTPVALPAKVAGALGIRSHVTFRLWPYETLWRWRIFSCR